MDVRLNNNIIQFYKFNMRDMIYNNEGEFLNPRIIIIAKSGSGKSWVVRDILSHMPNLPCGTVIAPTDRVTKFFDDIMPPAYIHHQFDIEILDNIFKRQEAIQEKNKKRIKKKKKPIDPRVFYIMDDCMSSKKEWIKDRNMMKLMYEGRHYQITYLLTMQYSLGIPPELRSQFDFIFLLGEDMVSNKKKLYDHYAGMFPNFNVFKTIFDQITEDYGCMVINNRIKSNDLKQKVFWYKANNIKKLYIGDSDYKKYHSKHFDPKHNKRNKIIDASTLFESKKVRW